MGILSIVNRNLVSNSKSRLKKHLSSSSSNLWLSRRAQYSQSPSSEKKPDMFVVEHFQKSKYFSDPGNCSLVSNSWKDCLSCNPFSAADSIKKYRLAGCCNELMLLFVQTDDFNGNREALWNPTTNKIKILPQCDFPRPVSDFPVYTGIVAHGFGFDPKSADYKLVRFPRYYTELSQTDYGSPTIVELYSLKTNSWKNITSSYPLLKGGYPFYPFHDTPFQKPSVHINGVYYWEKANKGRTIPVTSILSFDFATENFSSEPHIPVPPNFEERESCEGNFALVEIEGSLAALVHDSRIPGLKIDEEEKPFSFEVWVWNGESWLQKMPRTQIRFPGGGGGVASVVGLFQDDKLFLQGFDDDKGGDGGGADLLLFDCATRKLKNLGFPAYPGRLNIFPFNAGSFVLSTQRNVRPCTVSNSWKDCHNLSSSCNPSFSAGIKKYYLAGSCNKLMFFFFETDDFNGVREALWNPTTNKITILPQCDLPRPFPDCPVYTGIVAYGFGFDPKSADYKLVRILEYLTEWSPNYDGPTVVELYSLKTNSWKNITSSYPLLKNGYPFYPYHDTPSQKLSVHINDVYYWEKANEACTTPVTSILSFDFANENFSSEPHIPVPPNFEERLSCVDDFVLVEIDGSLAALVHDSRERDVKIDEEKPFSFEVWVWNGESWLQKVPRTPIHVPGGGGVGNVVGLFQDDKLFLQGFDDDKAGGGGGANLLLFDRATRKLENLGIRAYPGRLNIFPFNSGSSVL